MVRLDGMEELVDVMDRLPPVADHRIPYGAGRVQFGDLWVPKTHGSGDKFPLAVFFHGGWWQSGYDLAYAGELCAALKAEGVAVWSVEYRRVGDAGGGWPGTFQDAAAGLDYAATLAKQFPLDWTRVVAVGHSAGGQLAFWQAGRHHIPEGSELHELHTPAVALRGVVALAGAVDLRLICDLAGYLTYAHDKREVWSLMGGPPAAAPERYRAANPGDLLPLGVRQVLIQGADDNQIPPELPRRWAENARRQGDDVTVTIVPGTGHFDLVDPHSTAWPAVRAAVLGLLR